MNFTKDERKWIEQTKNLRLGNMLDKLNQRVQAYKYHSMTIAKAQEQALIDFRNFIEPGEFIPTTEQTDFDNLVYFKAAK